MKAVFSLQPFKEVEISATPLEWRAFALAVMEHGAIVPCEPVTNAAPYADYARKIHVLHQQGKKVVFAISPEADLIVQGDPLFLENLSETANNFANDFAKGSHIHIDYQGDEHYVGKDSASTVLVLGE
jgi:hypothetical protein